MSRRRGAEYLDPTELDKRALKTKQIQADRVRTVALTCNSCGWKSKSLWQWRTLPVFGKHSQEKHKGRAHLLKTTADGKTREVVPRARGTTKAIRK